MSVLVDTEIRALADSINLIESFSEDSLEGASYDMRLGSKYVFKGQVNTLTDEKPSLILEPGAFVVLTTYELLHMPLNLIGHNGIMSPWAKRGLVSLFSPQIDPGFKGMLTVPVFNAGDASITLDLATKIFTVEFAHTVKAASYGWSERHGVQKGLNAGVIPAVTRPSLSDLFGVVEEVDAFRRQMSEMQNVATSKLAELELQTKTSTKHLEGLEQRFQDFREDAGQRRTNLLAFFALLASIAAIVVTLTGHS
jgi:deoxycytidine triphosphate deaminase